MTVSQRQQRLSRRPGRKSSIRIVQTQAPSVEPARQPKLRRRLLTIDAICAFGAWSIALAIPNLPAPRLSTASTVLGLIGLTAVTVCVFGMEKLYLSRVCAVRSEEKVRLLHSVIVLVATGALFSAVVLNRTYLSRFAVGGGLVLVFVVLGRVCFHHWIRVARARGRFLRSVVVIGTNHEATEIASLVETHPEVGMEVVGMVGDRNEVPLGSRWLGDMGRARHAVEHAGASGVIMVVSALEPQQFRNVMREMFAAGVHVHLSSGLSGLNYRRVRFQPLSHEPLFYVEPLALAHWQLAMKRSVDFVLASIGLVFAMPAMLLAAVAIKLTDGGPVLFQQIRIGHDGKPFRFLKLRSMRVDALHNHDVDADNERTGPLFKASKDPRRTRVGRILEATSLDELPQLFNVLRGDMSLIGPRPALPHEVERFDEEFMIRHKMRPGITGLWQVEGRDNPSFAAYRRLDLFYIENWSLLLDLTILATTAQVVIARSIHKLWAVARHRDEEEIDISARESAG